MAGISSPPTTKPSNTLSPLPQTPTSSRPLVGGVPVTPDNNMMIPPHILASYMGVVDPIGPKTPIQSYPSGWVGGAGSGTPEVHPLQRAILIQNQFTTQVCNGTNVSHFSVILHHCLHLLCGFYRNVLCIHVLYNKLAVVIIFVYL